MKMQIYTSFSDVVCSIHFLSHWVSLIYFLHDPSLSLAKQLKNIGALKNTF